VRGAESLQRSQPFPQLRGISAGALALLQFGAMSLDVLPAMLDRQIGIPMSHVRRLLYEANVGTAIRFSTVF
jgi:hypothetical protein